MKIGILTFHYSNNYGALFQAYALRNYLVELGHEVELINYQRGSKRNDGKVELSGLISKANLKLIYNKAIDIKERYFGNKHKNKSFQVFKKYYLEIDDNIIFKSKEDLEKANLYYDLLITGSDQVWNPSDRLGLDPVYFLDFKSSNKNVKKVSYAPSFGKNTIDNKYKNELSKYISKLDHISVRENSAQNIIENLTSKKVILLPDPTVLVKDYSSIMNNYNTNHCNYIFCYYLRSRDIIGEITEYISQQKSLHIYSPHNPHRRWKEIGETVYPGPREWLYLLHNSKFVITNSFHGTILSIILNKPFLTVSIGSGDKKKYNERALNILKQCGLSARFITDFNKISIDELINENINWKEINKKIDNIRQDAVSYINNCLEN